MEPSGDHIRETAHASLTALSAEEIPAELDLLIEQRITDGPEIVSSFQVELRDGHARVLDGSAGDLAKPDIIISQSRRTAEQLQHGDLHAQTAFLTGELSIDGDIDKLLANGSALSRVLTALQVGSGGGHA